MGRAESSVEDKPNNQYCQEANQLPPENWGSNISSSLSQSITELQISLSFGLHFPIDYVCSCAAEECSVVRSTLIQT